jgi:hypothetical protein
VAREAPQLFDRSDQELERRRQALSYDVIWGEGSANSELEDIERELDRRARLRAEEQRAQVQAAREEAWRRMQEEDAAREAEERAAKAAEQERLRAEEERLRAEGERLLAEEERRRAEEERLRAEEERLRAEEERRRLEEEEQARAAQERRDKEQALRTLAAEQVQTARLLDFGTKRIVELAAEYVEREDAMHALAAETGLIGSKQSGHGPESSDQSSERFSRAPLLLGQSLRAQLSGIPSLRLKPNTSHNGNGGSNGKQTSLESRTRGVLADLLALAEGDQSGSGSGG